MKGYICGISISKSISRQKQSYLFASMTLPGFLQYQGKLKERANILFVWMKLLQFIFYHPENLCSYDTNGSWRENISTARWKDISTTPLRKIVPRNGILNFFIWNDKEHSSCIWKGNSKGTKEKENSNLNSHTFQEVINFFKYLLY
jgi:hypothetical protein